MFIRETELVRLDDWADKMEKRVVSGEFLKDTKDRRKTSLVRENEHRSELRLEEGGDRITLVVLKRRVWYSKSRSHLGKLQSHRRSCFSVPQFKSASYFSGPSQKANAPLIVPLTVADKAIALV